MIFRLFYATMTLIATSTVYLSCFVFSQTKINW